MLNRHPEFISGLVQHHFIQQLKSTENFYKDIKLCRKGNRKIGM